MEKRKNKLSKTRPVPKPKAPQSEEVSNKKHKEDFNRLLDDAVLGVKKK